MSRNVPYLARFAPLLCLAMALPSTALAQDEEEVATEPEETEEAKAPAEKSAPKAPAESDERGPIEKPHEKYQFVGLRYRSIIIPKFIFNMFADGGRTVHVASLGPEFTTRKDDFEIVFALTYADYSMPKFPFKGSTDPEASWELVESDLSLFYATVDLLSNVPIDDRGTVAFVWGGGVGLGLVLGELKRNQAYALDPQNPTEEGYDFCNAPGSPATPARDGSGPYCGTDNEHYDGYVEESWFKGGSRPVVFPWIAFPQFGLRYKPVKEFQARFDVGFSISGIFLGVAGHYGL